MQLRSVLEAEQLRQKMSFGVIEQDYILSRILYGISAIDDLRETLAFKGGTALKKIYFGNYRFSQDLDFTALEGAPERDALEELIRQACLLAQKELLKKISNPVIVCSRYTEKNPHPHGQEAFVIRAQLPWHKYPYVRVMVEVTRNQRVVNSPILKEIIHGYGDDLKGKVLTYSLDEIFGEKLIAMYRNAIKLHEQGWARSRVRDYYDLWRLINSFRNELNAQKILDTIMYKYPDRLPIKTIDDFFDPRTLQGVKRDWDIWLGPMVYPLPPCDQVINELKEELKNLFSIADMQTSIIMKHERRKQI